MKTNPAITSHLLITASATVFCAFNTSSAALVNIGDTQSVTLVASQNGDPYTNLAWGFPIAVTAGLYRFHLEPSVWYPYAFFSPLYAPYVGGVEIVSSDVQTTLMYDPSVGGTTDVNSTVRTIDFAVPSNQTVLAGLADNQIFDNSGTVVFTLTKIGLVPEPTSALLLLGGGALLALRRRRSPAGA